MPPSPNLPIHTMVFSPGAINASQQPGTAHVIRRNRILTIVLPWHAG